MSSDPYDPYKPKRTAEGEGEASDTRHELQRVSPLMNWHLRRLLAGTCAVELHPGACFCSTSCASQQQPLHSTSEQPS